jgi:hypothetical protein
MASFVYAVDPGSTDSALVILSGLDGKVVEAVKQPNGALATRFYQQRAPVGSFLVVEKIESYGMPVGVEVFDTVFWVGRFVEAWMGVRPSMQDAWTLLPRRAVKLALCGSMKATDATIRQALIDRYGPSKEKAIGRKASPGPLYGLKADLWSALALGVTYLEQRKAAA